VVLRSPSSPSNIAPRAARSQAPLTVMETIYRFTGPRTDRRYHGVHTRVSRAEDIGSTLTAQSNNMLR